MRSGIIPWQRIRRRKAAPVLAALLLLAALALPGVGGLLVEQLHPGVLLQRRLETCVPVLGGGRVEDDQPEAIKRRLDLYEELV